MGAAAIAARVQLARKIRPRAATAKTLAFDVLGGPLVAVCGLAGGAATSTLAILLAREAAAASAAPILLTEADPQRAGLCVIAGRATPRPLTGLAQELADERAPTDTFLVLDPGLRLIAAEPQAIAKRDSAALGALLDQARDAHGLVVVDCGTSWTAHSPVLAHATHVVWTIPATPLGLAVGHRQLHVAPPAGRSPEVLAAAAITPQTRILVRALRKLARRRCEQLVLIPHDEALAYGQHTTSDATLRAIAAMAPTLRSRR
jgi:cellulose biosynthesis protein BcsQ